MYRRSNMHSEAKIYTAAICSAKPAGSSHLALPFAQHCGQAGRPCGQAVRGSARVAAVVSNGVNAVFRQEYIINYLKFHRGSIRVNIISTRFHMHPISHACMHAFNLIQDVPRILAVIHTHRARVRGPAAVHQAQPGRHHRDSGLDAFVLCNGPQAI